MKAFMDKDFLLESDTARELFAAANEMPIFDWHCHLSPKEIYENRRARGYSMALARGRSLQVARDALLRRPGKVHHGDASPREKFMAWAKIMPYLLGNPLYHWTHLELQRYFGIYEPLSEKTAEDIWNRANAKIAAGGFTPRELIENSNVVCLCTTDDAADSLEYHKLIAEDKSFKCRVIPAFRPDKALGIELPATATG